MSVSQKIEVNYSHRLKCMAKANIYPWHHSQMHWNLVIKMLARIGVVVIWVGCFGLILLWPTTTHHHHHQNHYRCRCRCCCHRRRRCCRCHCAAALHCYSIAISFELPTLSHTDCTSVVTAVSDKCIIN